MGYCLKNVNETYHRLLKRLGLSTQVQYPYARHTVASIIVISENISIVYMSKYLGYVSVIITQKHYISLVPE